MAKSLNYRKKLLKKWHFAFILLVLWGRANQPAQAQNVASNLHFIESVLAQRLSEFVTSAAFTSDSLIDLQVVDRIGDAEAVAFVRDVLLTVAAEHRLQLRLADASAAAAAPASRHLQVSVEGWRFTVGKNRANPEKGRYVQQFDTVLRFVLTDGSGKILSAKKAAVSAARWFAEVEEIRRAGEHQPPFARADMQESSGRHWLQTAGITIASGITVFLLYHIRSR